MRLLSLAALAVLGSAPAVAAVAPSFDWEVRDLAGNQLDYGSFQLDPILEGDKVIGYEVAALTSPIIVNTVDNGTLVREATISSVSGFGLWDPAFIYGIAVQDNGAASVFSFSITAPLLPTVTPVPQIKANVAGTLTDQSGDGASLTPYSLTPFGPAASLQTVRLSPGSVNAGVNGGPAASIAATGVPGTFKSYAAAGSPAYYFPGPTAAETLNGPPGSYDSLSITNTFQLSGGNDAFVANGFVEITAVPEPGTWLLLVSGLGMLGALVRRATPT